MQPLAFGQAILTSSKRWFASASPLVWAAWLSCDGLWAGHNSRTVPPGKAYQMQDCFTTILIKVMLRCEALHSVRLSSSIARRAQHSRDGGAHTHNYLLYMPSTCANTIVINNATFTDSTLQLTHSTQTSMLSVCGIFLVYPCSAGAFVSWLSYLFTTLLAYLLLGFFSTLILCLFNYLFLVVVSFHYSVSLCYVLLLLSLSFFSCHFFAPLFSSFLESRGCCLYSCLPVCFKFSSFMLIMAPLICCAFSSFVCCFWALAFLNAFNSLYLFFDLCVCEVVFCEAVSYYIASHCFGCSLLHSSAHSGAEVRRGEKTQVTNHIT